MIRTECSVCRQEYRLKDEMGGNWVRCRECQAGFYVPKKYTERFERFLERAPKPQTTRVRRAKGPRPGVALAPLSPSPLAPIAAVAPTPCAPPRPSRLSLPALDREQLQLVGLGLGGLAVMAFMSFMTFLIAGVAMG